MNHRRSFLQMTGVMLVVLLVGCTTPQPAPTSTPIAAAPTFTPVPPTATPLPPTKTPTSVPPTLTLTPVPATPTAAPTRVQWTYAALGADDVSRRPGYPDFYTEHIEEDLGVEVKVSRLGEGNDPSSSILTRLQWREDPRGRSWPEVVSAADVVTLRIGANDVAWLLINKHGTGECGGEDDLDCVREAVETFKANYDAILTELLELCKPGAIIRTMTLHYESLAKWGFDGDVKPFLEPMNDYIIQAAAEHNIPVALAHVAFHGPDGDQDPAAMGYVTADGKHLSELGATVVSDLLQELGYESTCP